MGYDEGMSWRLSIVLLAAGFVSLTCIGAEPSLSVDRAFVLGEVQSPGAVALIDSGMTVYDVVAQCGGLTRLADGRSIRLIHHLPDHKQTIAKIDLARLMMASGTASASPTKSVPAVFDPVVQPGDVIVVPQALFKDK